MDVVTLVHGTSFCISGNDGDVDGAVAQGLFYQDTRILSRWSLRLDGSRVQPITVVTPTPFHATFLGRGHPGSEDPNSALLVRRDRYVAAGMREDIVLHNYGTRTVSCTVSLHADADFADLFEVKEERVRPRGSCDIDFSDSALALLCYVGDGSRGIRIRGTDAEYGRDWLTFHAVVPPKGDWSASVVALPTVDGEQAAPMFPLESPVEQSEPAERLRRWRAGSPVVRRGADPATARTLQRSREDLGALRIFDPEHLEDVVIAAGAPWFMALFGRDSLLASLMALPIDPTLALGTAQTLARHQGVRTEPNSEEEPGRILHEVRFGADVSLALGGSSVYYGTVDATPLFVMLLGELSRWGIGRDEVEALLPHADRALEWIDRYGDRDGDGFVEYARATERGLVNQGWKDSWDGVNFADGRIAEPPIALCEVQGYVYAAFVARAELADTFGDPEGGRYWRQRAARLKELFHRRFWLPGAGRYAVALDGGKRPVDAVASNIGHCLWTGIVDPDRAAGVADSLLSPEMFSGWGVRTLASDMGAYNPMSYHNGSVWPHDNALIAAGLMRYGFVGHAQRVASAVFDAAAAFDGRLPELLCGFDRAEYADPVPYPTSCSPQAWASAAPVHLLRTLLRVEPCVPEGTVRIAPALPGSLATLTIDDVPLGSGRIRIDVDDNEADVHGLPDGVKLLREPLPLT
ncbi:glycogen debranching enzyme [Prauserella shujinwangii]|uniref:Glycogen debranching enzyme n=1 Tax=Prauserella shujinwangii TaxID=1453103 RepID=A0A2T0M2G9_9PSEU|nr:glycogen debranching N-terminal domain-containing protein [Prauserella shujinwangii]PRX50899.1 glycogen debranching enzyme [Prauserella shujinwangii]